MCQEANGPLFYDGKPSLKWLHNSRKTSFISYNSNSVNSNHMKTLLLCGFLSTCVWAGTTTALYNPVSPTTGPFPANALTTRDAAQRTGLRIDLPSSFDTCDVTESPSVCSNTSLLNQLDGFSVNPRIMVCFSAPVDSKTLQIGIHIIPARGGASVPINQVIIDPNSNCVFAK